MGLLHNIQNANNWNIGFCDCTPNELIANKRLPEVQWMKHPYRDRFFADPFILQINDTEISVLAEEFVFDSPPGLIVELVLDRECKRLKKRFELLRLDTHLSYPAIIRDDNDVYVYPENGASGKLNIYRYDANTHKLVDPICILNEAVADATITKMSDGLFWMIATKYPDTIEKSFLYKAESFKGPFHIVSEIPFQTSPSCSRPAGNFFEAFGALYRPAQNCLNTYGGSTAVMLINDAEQTESRVFDINPLSKTYPLGLHTINFYDGICVIDSLGYLYPRFGKLYVSETVTKLRNWVKQTIKKGK